jgi:Ras-related protein Rab-1A
MSYNTVTEFDYIFRILLVGDNSVGKTSLLQRYIENTFSDIYMPTIGIDFKIRTVKLDKKIVKLQLYDSGGGDHFQNIVSAYYPNADAIVIVYDISDIDSFRHVERWLRDSVKYHSSLKRSAFNVQNVSMFLIGNKTDLPSYRRVVSSTAGETLARQHGMIFFETSAKNKIQTSYLPPQIPVEKVFIEICKECLFYKLPREIGPLLSSFESTDNKEPDTKKYCFCC